MLKVLYGWAEQNEASFGVQRLGVEIKGLLL